MPGPLARLALTVLLLLVATAVRAEWVKVGENDGAVLYVDPSTLVKSGDFRRIWTLTDVKWSRGDDVVSFRTLYDFNCKEARRRAVSRISYAGPMATGKVIDSGKPTPEVFEKVLSYTPGASQFEYVCKEP